MSTSRTLTHHRNKLYSTNVANTKHNDIDGFEHQPITVHNR